MADYDRSSPQVKRDEIPEEDRPLSEQFRIVALAWCDANSAASLQEELKTTTLEKWKNELVMSKGGNMPDSHAERMVKAQPRWEAYIRQMCADRANADKRKAQMEYLRMRFHEWQSREANQRHEARLSRG